MKQDTMSKLRGYYNNSRSARPNQYEAPNRTSTMAFRREAKPNDTVRYNRVSRPNPYRKTTGKR